MKTKDMLEAEKRLNENLKAINEKITRENHEHTVSIDKMEQRIVETMTEKNNLENDYYCVLETKKDLDDRFAVLKEKLEEEQKKAEEYERQIEEQRMKLRKVESDHKMNLEETSETLMGTFYTPQRPNRSFRSKSGVPEKIKKSLLLTDNNYEEDKVS